MVPQHGRIAVWRRERERRERQLVVCPRFPSSPHSTGTYPSQAHVSDDDAG